VILYLTNGMEVEVDEGHEDDLGGGVFDIPCHTIEIFEEDQKKLMVLCEHVVAYKK
jgi:hypothetical protein